MLISTLLGLLAGAMLPMQADINARLARLFDSAIWAAAVSGLVLLAALVTVGLVATRGLPQADHPSSLPWWAWTGGLCGAIMLTATTMVAPRIGTAALIGLVVTGQVVCSLIIDRFGLFGAEVHPLTVQRLAGAALLSAGAFLIR